MNAIIMFFNRSVSGIRLFSNHDNHLYFLRKFSEYLSGVLAVYAWCLLPNHFHFLVSVKSENDCILNEKEIEKIKTGSATIHELITRRFKNFFLAYSHAYKRQQRINTNIFAQHFRRSEVDKADYFSTVISYIHLNPLHHGITTNWKEYPWSSYQRIEKNTTSLLRAKEVIDWFGGLEAFVKYHQVRELKYLDNGGSGFLTSWEP